MASTKTFKMKGFLRWAKLTEETMDKYVKHFKTSHGRFMIDFYPENETEYQKYLDNGGPEVSLGYTLYRGPDNERYGNGDENLGTGSYLRLKRDNWSKLYEKDLGPIPTYDLRESDPTQRWDFDNEPTIWNGSAVIVEVDIWGDGEKSIVTLQKVAVTELGSEPEAQDPDVRNEAF